MAPNRDERLHICHSTAALSDHVTATYKHVLLGIAHRRLGSSYLSSFQYSGFEVSSAHSPVSAVTDRRRLRHVRANAVVSSSSARRTAPLRARSSAQIYPEYLQEYCFARQQYSGLVEVIKAARTGEAMLGLRL